MGYLRGFRLFENVGKTIIRHDTAKLVLVITQPKKLVITPFQVQLFYFFCIVLYCEDAIAGQKKQCSNFFHVPDIISILFNSYFLFLISLLCPSAGQRKICSLNNSTTTVETATCLM